MPEGRGHPAGGKLAAPTTNRTAADADADADADAEAEAEAEATPPFTRETGTKGTMTAPAPLPLRRPRRRCSPPAALVLLALVLSALLAAPARAAEVIKRGAMQGLFDKIKSAGGSAAAGVVNAAAAAMGGAARSAIVDEVKRGVLRFPRGEPLAWWRACSPARPAHTPPPGSCCADAAKAPW